MTSVQQDIKKIKGFVIQTRKLYQIIWQDGEATDSDYHTVHALKNQCKKAGYKVQYLDSVQYGYQELVKSERPVKPQVASANMDSLILTQVARMKDGPRRGMVTQRFNKIF